MTLSTIGVFESEQLEPYQAGRQPDELGLSGRIRMKGSQNFEQALQDLSGCSHIWIIFGFHLNQTWRPLTSPPRADKKIGVFATRAPYRPNPIGLSLVKLIKVDGLVVDVGENDILNNSPIYDIKPFHPEYDRAENARIMWLENSLTIKHAIFFSPMAEAQLDYLEKYKITEMRAFISRQLEYDPLNDEKKRVAPNASYWTLAYRTWRIDFSVSETSIGILSIRTGYSEKELLEFDDKYADKKTHRLFMKEFG